MGVYRREYWLSWILIDLLVVIFVTCMILLCLYVPFFHGEPKNHTMSSQPIPLVALVLLLHGVEIISFTCLIANSCPNASFGVSIGLLARLLIASIVSETAIYGALFEHVACNFVPGASIFIFMEAKVNNLFKENYRSLKIIKYLLQHISLKIHFKFYQLEKIIANELEILQYHFCTTKPHHHST